MPDRSNTAIHKFFPEVAAGGFSRIDGTVEFYARVNSLLSPSAVVVDFGAGRGQHTEWPNGFRRDLRDIRSRVDRVIGLDVDEAVLQNTAVDERYVVTIGTPLPLANESVDLILSDFTFEHVDTPEWVASEFQRVLKNGGWICARTPNKYGYISVFARLVPNQLHDLVLRLVQPSKKTVDTFPTRYRLNTRRDLRRHFSVRQFEHIVYEYDSEPAYMANSTIGWILARLVTRLLPSRLHTMLFVFLRKT